MSENTAENINSGDELMVVTDAAVNKVKGLVEEEGNSSLMLRVFVTGGGCSGFQYGFTFEDAINDGDTEVEKDGIKLLVDPMSFQYLVGAEIDYKEDLEGSRFVIKNPNATTTCGCGSSFSARGHSGSRHCRVSHRRTTSWASSRSRIARPGAASR